VTEADPAFSRINFDVVRGAAAVKAAAYNLSGKLGDYDFRRKAADYVDGCVLLPEGAPDRYLDREMLWRTLESCERQANGQPGRQVLVSIPRECPAHLHIGLARAIAEPWVADGMAAQLDVHSPRATDGGRNPHLHVLLSMRQLTPDGPAKTKNRDWNARFREDQGRAERARIADRCNAFFAAHDLKITIDHRSLEARGVDRAPEPVAPAQDWQRWLREGALPEAQPITVQRVVQHRELRKQWQQARRTAAAWGRHAEDLERQAERVQRGNAAQVRPAAEGGPAPPPSNNRNKNVRPAEKKIAQAPGNPRAPTMTHSKPSSLPSPQVASWMRGVRGWEGLTIVQQTVARAAYERWLTRSGRPGGSYPLVAYVTYVQDRRAREQAARQNEVQTASPATPVNANGIAPASSITAERSRLSHLERLLAERYAVPAALAQHVKRIEIDADGRRAILHTSGGRITDHGDRLMTSGTTNPVLARAIIAAAAARGWASIRLTGSLQYREAVAVAAALHRPPLETDHELSGKGRQTVAAQLRQRALSEVPALADLTGLAPTAAARARIDHETALAEAALAGEPKSERDPHKLAAPLVTEVAAKRDTARAEANEAAQAAAAHRQIHGWVARLADPATRHRQRALDREAQARQREADRLCNGYDKAVRQIQREVERQAKQRARDYDDWARSPPVRQARTTLLRLAIVAAPVEAGDQETIHAAATTGSLAPALAAAEAHRKRQAEAAAEEERQRLAARTPKQLREDALKAALTAEQSAGADPRKQEAVRRVTAAVCSGDQETIRAAANNDMAAADKAATAWQRKRDREAEECRRKRELAEALVAGAEAARTRGYELRFG
jgi:hypothetical protein